MEIKVVGTANTKQMEASLASVQRRAEALNATLKETTLIPAGGTPAGFRQQAARMASLTRAYDSAMAASGAYRVEQVRLNSVIEKNTDLLNRQKLGFSQVFGRKAQQNMKQVYREQLAMQQMLARTVKGGISDGRLQASLYIPTEVHKSWDTLNNRVGMFGYRLSSASRVLLNFGKNTQWAGRQLMAGLTYPLAAAGAAAAVMAYKVDQQFTRIRKVYNTTADQFSASVDEQMAAQRELDQLREDGAKTAMDAAKQYGSTITDTLGVQADLAATGEKGIALQKATTEVMKNAMLGEIDYQTATKATIALQQQLHASSGELADQWAYMNAVENQTSLQMKDFAEAIPIALGPIRMMGGDLQDLGTLMTAMVSQGIEVGKAANAIKALPQRLSRPSKQVQEEFKAMTGQDILKINAEHGDNIIDLLTAIYHATQPLEDQARKKVFAGLFGSFQLSTMNAMVQSMGDLEKHTNQVSVAFDIGRQSSEEWGKVQQQEIKQFRESASGQFKIALATIQASLAQAGEPFLMVATKVLKGITSIIKGFNQLPDIFKKGAMAAIITGAVIGPLIMMIGLFANLVANAGLLVGWLLRVASGFKLLNKAEVANNMINQLANKGFSTRATEAQLLRERVEALTAAFNEMSGAAERNAQVLAAHGVAPSMAGTAPLTGKGSTMLTSAMLGGYGAARMGVVPIAEQERRVKLAEDLKMNEQQRLRAAIQNSQQAAAEEKIRAKTRETITGTGVAMGAMTAAMVAQMVTQNKTVDEAAKWLMILSLAVPLIKGAGAATVAMATNMKAAAAASMLQVKATSAGAAETALMAGRWRTVVAGAKGATAAIGAAVGPVGLITAALVVGAGIVYKVWQNEKKITEEKRKQAMAMYDQNNLLQDQLKIETRRKQTLSATSVGDLPGGPTVGQLTDTLLNDESAKPLITTLKDKNISDAEKTANILTKYRDILEATGGSAQKAQTYIEALYRAAGMGALEAQKKASDLNKTIGGEFDNMDLQNLWSNQIQAALDDTWDDKSLKEQGTQLGKDFADSIAKAGHEGANTTIMQMQNLFATQLAGEWNQFVAKMGPSFAEMFQKFGIQGFRDLQEFQAKWNKDPAHGAEMANQLGIVGDQLKQLDQFMSQFSTEGTRAGAILGTEAAAAKELARQIGVSADDMKEINSLAELRNTWEWQIQAATKQSALALYNQKVAADQLASTIGGTLLGSSTEMTDQQKLQVANQILWNLYGKQAVTLAQALGMLSGKFADETERAAGAARNLAQSFSLSKDDVKNIYKSGMEGVENVMADSAMNAFSKRMDSAIDAAQNAWDDKMDALQTRQERQMDKFENRWDRRKDQLKDYYDKRRDAIDSEIKAEEDAEKTREAIFEAEQKRIERMKDIANANIDFNIALRTGNLDEAARIQNDMRAQAQSYALGDAADAGKSRSDQRIDALNNQKDLLDDQQQQAENALEKREELERKHLEKMQEMQKDALQKQSENSMDALKAQWDAEKDSFNDRLELFKSYIARDQTDLEKWMQQVGLSYDDFGIGVKAKGEEWSKFFKQTLYQQIHEAGVKVASDNMWTEWGAAEVKKMLLGMGFNSMGKFKKFIMTGELPDDFGRPKGPKAGHGTGGINPAANHPVPLPGETLHSGGMVGAGINNRNGVARGTRGLHPSEIMVRAQKGEFVVNRDVAKKNPDVLNYFNKHGELPGGDTRIYRNANLEGLGAGVIGAMARGVGKSLMNAFVTKGQASGQAKQNAFRSASGASGVTPYTGIIGEPNKTGANAIAWAVKQIGVHAWYQLCQKFVRTALGAPGGFASAEDAWYGAKYRHSIGDPSKVPPGVPVYWTDGGNGHVALSTGGGNVISTDYPNSGIVGTGTIAGITSAWHKNLAGWTEDINGKRIFTPEGLRGGGYTTKDTPAVVHQGEMTIDKNRTKKLYGLVDSFTDADQRMPWLAGLYKIGPNGMPDASNFAAVADAANKQTAATGGRLRNGTYNVRFSSSNEETLSDLKRLFGMADVLSLTEFVKSKRALIPAINKLGWGIAGSGESVVAYNKSKFNASNVGSRGLNKTLGQSLSGAIGAGGAGAQSAAYALLSGSGMKFWQIAAHTIAHIWKNPTLNRKVQQEQFGNLANLAKNLGKTGSPVFIGGDLNNDPRSMGGSRPGGRQGMEFFKALTAAGLSSNWTQAFMAANNPTFGDRFIDHVFFNAMAKLINTKTVGGLHSDHKAVISEFALPQLARGGHTLSDGIAMLHNSETVLTKDLSNQFKQGVENFANGAGNTYNTTVILNEADMSPEELAAKIKRVQQRQEARKPVRTTNR